MLRSRGRISRLSGGWEFIVPCKFDGKSFQENGKKFSVAKVESFTPLDGEVAKKIPTFYILGGSEGERHLFDVLRR